MDVSIIIVNYNTKDLLANCLRSIYEKTKDVDFEVIVSDNGSTDGSIEMVKKNFPRALLIENNTNLGFGAANNRGLDIAKGKYVFYLNSDTLLLNNATKYFLDYFEENGQDENVGALGCNLINSSGDFIHSGGNFPNINLDIMDRICNIYGFLKLAFMHMFFSKRLPSINKINCKKHIGNIDYITGADLFLKNDCNASFDEGFFMYCEETYLQFKLAEMKKKRLLIDGPQIIHLEGASSKKTSADIIYKEGEFSNVQNKISRIIYYKKIGEKKIKIFILRFLTVILWMNPLILKKNAKYIKRILLV